MNNNEEQQFAECVNYFDMTPGEKKELAALEAEVSTKAFEALPWVDRCRSEVRLKSLQDKSVAEHHREKVEKVQQTQQEQAPQRQPKEPEPQFMEPVPYHQAANAKPAEVATTVINVEDGESFVLGTGKGGMKPGRYISPDGHPDGPMLWVSDK